MPSSGQLNSDAARSRICLPTAAHPTRSDNAAAIGATRMQSVPSLARGARVRRTAVVHESPFPVQHPGRTRHERAAPGWPVGTSSVPGGRMAHFVLSDQGRLVALVGLCGLLWTLECLIPLRRSVTGRLQHGLPNIALTALLVLLNVVLSFGSAALVAHAGARQLGLLFLHPVSPL